MLRAATKTGSSTRFVGEIVGIQASEATLDEDENLDITQVRPILLAPSNRTYIGVGAFLGRPFSIGKQIG